MALMRSSGSEHSPRPDRISIFVGTWNMAEQPLPEKISDWIPSGRDLYAVGLQECMDARSVRCTVLCDDGWPICGFG